MILFILILPVVIYLTNMLVFPKTKGMLKPLKVRSDK